MTIRHVLATAAVMGALAGPAAAQDFYWGVGIGITDATSEPNAVTTNESEATFGTLGLTGGFRWDTPTMFYAAEANLDIGLGADFDDAVTGLPCETSAAGPYYCSQEATLRLRGLLGTDIGGGYELFGSLGFAAMQGQGAISPFAQDRGINSGYTVGVGVQRAMAGGTMHRLELIYDNLSNTIESPTDGITSYDPDYEAVSLNYTFLFN